MPGTGTGAALIYSPRGASWRSLLRDTQCGHSAAAQGLPLTGHPTLCMSVVDVMAQCTHKHCSWPDRVTLSVALAAAMAYTMHCSWLAR